MDPLIHVGIAFVVFAVGFFVGGHNPLVASKLLGEGSTALTGAIAAVKADVAAVAADVKAVKTAVVK